MKKIVVLICVVASSLLLNACGKKDEGCQPVSVSAEKAQLVAYCMANNINYTESTSGLLYEIILPGSGVAPTTASTVSVVYTGKLLTGATFTTVNTSQDLPLSSVIDGWKIGLPLIKKGGRIKLIIPSALAWSCTGNGTAIPANSPVFFDITLSDVK